MLLGIIFSFSALENAAYAKGRSPIESLCIYSIGSSVLIVVSLIDYRKIMKYLFLCISNFISITFVDSLYERDFLTIV